MSTSPSYVSAIVCCEPHDTHTTLMAALIIARTGSAVSTEMVSLPSYPLELTPQPKISPRLDSATLWNDPHAMMEGMISSSRPGHS